MQPKRRVETFYARICWNESGWIKPDGSAWRYEKPDAFTGKNGFGYEEWLFNDGHQIGGYRYGFIQAVNTSAMLQPGSRADIILFTVDPKINGRTHKQRLFVGTLEACERLTENMARESVRIFRDRKWLSKMASDVTDATADLPVTRGEAERTLNDPTVPATNIINIRYRWSDRIHPRELVSVPRGHPIYKMHHYTSLCEANDGEGFDDIYAGTQRGAPGTKNPLRLPPPNAQPALPSSLFSGDTPQNQYIHRQMQNKLLREWRTEYGKDCVLLEDYRVDVKVRTDDRLILCEVKARRPARQAIREALGQILEYAHYEHKEDKLKLELHVAGLSELTTVDREYLALLKKKYKVDITYHRVEVEEENDSVDGVVKKH